jgi:thiosulfate/3-mercaptopyruvate sulfurtransferase
MYSGFGNGGRGGYRGAVDADDVFVNSASLATAPWLANHLDDPRVVIVDTRYTVELDENGRFLSVPGTAAYLESHIPGAVFVNLDDLRQEPDPTSILSPDEFARAMSRLGVSNEHEVVVYDTEGGTWCARLWWALRYHGHDAVRILDGGFATWTAHGFPVEGGEVSRTPEAFEPQVIPGLRVEIDDVLDAIDDTHTVIVDALPEPFFTGQIPLYPHLRRGHIPGAANIAAPAQVDPTTWELLPPEQLAGMWAPVLEDTARIITYCGGGVYGAFDMFVLHLLGHESSLYDGSWEEWGARDDTPVETGPVRKRSEQ